MISVQPIVTLNDGNTIPQVGFGLFKVPNQEAAVTIGRALTAGYRLLDTAAVYGNEEGTGKGIAESPFKRDELFVTTKVWNNMHGYDNTLRACEESLKRLQLDYLDLYLIHWPLPAIDRYLDSWQAMIRLREEGLARSIGVSNFAISHLQRLIDETGMVPAVNQIELHPRFQQRELAAFHAEKGIVTECWSPLAQGPLLDDPTIVRIAERLERTPAQIVLRWHVEKGFVAIPKSVTPSRIVENASLFDFELDEAAHTDIAALDSSNGRIGPDPELFNYT